MRAFWECFSQRQDLLDIRHLARSVSALAPHLTWQHCARMDIPYRSGVPASLHPSLSMCVMQEKLGSSSCSPGLADTAALATIPRSREYEELSQTLATRPAIACCVPRPVSLRFIGQSGPPRSSSDVFVRLTMKFSSSVFSFDPCVHRQCPSATQHVTPPAAVPTRGNADDGRVGEDGQPTLPSITGGTLCSSKWSSTPPGNLGVFELREWTRKKNRGTNLKLLFSK